MTKRHVVGAARDIPPGKSVIVDVDGLSIGVFNVKGAYYALRNICPHQFAPLCLGEVTGMMLPSKPGEYIYGREGEIIRCPWHGWEFEIATGRSIFNPHRVRVRTYPVTVEARTTAACALEPTEPAPACAVEADDEDPSVETYDVTVEDEFVILHVPGRRKQ